MVLVYKTLKHPDYEDRLIPDEQNGAWDDLGPMTPVGVARHTMVGTLWGTDRWFRRGAQSSGLTTYGVGKDGHIIRWNDPRGLSHTVTMWFDVTTGTWKYTGGSDKIVSPRRAGWANGGSDGLEGDGPAFVRALGINAINKNLISIERDDEGEPHDNPYVDPQALTIDRLIAYWFDQMEVPWDSFPINPHVGGGLVTDFFHLEFAIKGCPWEKVIEQINASQDRIRSFLKAAQTETVEGLPLPPPSPIDPNKGLPEGWTWDDLNIRFGTMTRKRLDGTITKSGFSPNGAISNAWIARGIEEGRSVSNLPPAATMAEINNPKITIDGKPAIASVVLFDGRGSDNWVLYRPANSIAWRWMF